MPLLCPPTEILMMILEACYPPNPPTVEALLTAGNDVKACNRTHSILNNVGQTLLRKIALQHPNRTSPNDHIDEKHSALEQWKDGKNARLNQWACSLDGPPLESETIPKESLGAEIFESAKLYSFGYTGD